MIRLGITGTDTGVGKTVVAAALIGLLRQRGATVAAMKPVETGVETDVGTDAERLRDAAGQSDPTSDVNPVRYREPLAPYVAAERSHSAVDLSQLDAAVERLSRGRDALVVEGAGGLLVPLSRNASYADLFARWRLATIVVAANRLGAINHVLLTVQAARVAGLELRGVVLNAVTPAHDLAATTNPAAVTALLESVPVLTFPWVPCPWDDRALAGVAERCGLSVLIDPPSKDVS